MTSGKKLSAKNIRHPSILLLGKEKIHIAAASNDGMFHRLPRSEVAESVAAGIIWTMLSGFVKVRRGAALVRRSSSMNVQCHRSRRTKDIWTRRSLGDGARWAAQESAARSPGGCRARHQGSARKSSRSFQTAASGLLRVVRCPCPNNKRRKCATHLQML
jgi:hypothetical protein